MKCIEDDIYYKLSLDEINNISNINLRTETLTKYNAFIRQLKIGTKGISIDPCYGAPLEEICDYIYEEELSLSSEYVFPGDLVKVYKPFLNAKSRKPFTCPICTSRIGEGSEITIYKPFLWNISDDSSYVLKHIIRVDEHCTSFLPTDIKEIDEFQRKIDTAYENNDDFGYNLNCELGGGLHFVKLRK